MLMVHPLCLFKNFDLAIILTHLEKQLNLLKNFEFFDSKCRSKTEI